MKITYEDRPVSEHVMVFIDGKLCRRHIREADEERGEVVVYKENPVGLLTGKVYGENPETEVLTGKVEIRLNSNATADVTELYNKAREEQST